MINDIMYATVQIFFKIFWGSINAVNIYTKNNAINKYVSIFFSFLVENEIISIYGV